MHTPSHQQTARPWDLGPVLSQPSTNGSGFGSHARPDECNDPNEFCHQSHLLKVRWSAEGATGTSSNWAGHIQKKISRYFWGVDTFGSSCSGSEFKGFKFRYLFFFPDVDAKRDALPDAHQHSTNVWYFFLWFDATIFCCALISSEKWCHVRLGQSTWPKLVIFVASHISLPEDPAGQSHSLPQFLIHAS